MSPEKSTGRFRENVKFPLRGCRRMAEGRLDQAMCVPPTAELRKHIKTRQPRIEILARLAIPVDQADGASHLSVVAQNKRRGQRAICLMRLELGPSFRAVPILVEVSPFRGVQDGEFVGQRVGATE